jgi:photosystem II stability/assembly factor-like uncharacterized protein
MKTKLILFIVAFFAPFFAQSQWVNKWEKVNIPDRYSQQSYLDVFFLPQDRNYGWISGFRSQVSFTTDGGETWKTVNVDARNPVQLESIHFVNKKVGFTSGPPANQMRSGAIYKTTDGGYTWEDISPNTLLTITYWGNYFYDENNGFFVGGDCNDQYFFKTTNGGNSWTLKHYQVSGGSKLADIQVDGATGFGQAISSGLVWKTTDYGENWEADFKTGPNDWHEELAYKGDSFIIPVNESCFGSQGLGSGGMLFTTDRGKTFERKTLSHNPMYGSFLIDENTGWVCGFNAAAFFTCDGGKNWENLNCGLDGDLDDIYFIDDTTGWIVGDDVFRTKNVSESNAIVSIDTIRVCEGVLVDLKIDTSAKYANYNWSNCGFGEANFSVGEGKYRVYAYNDPCDTAYIYEYVVEYYKHNKPEINSFSNGGKCEGDTVVLSIAKDYDTALWSTGSTDSSIIVTQSGRYIVTTTSVEGCTDSDTIDVAFNPVPHPNIIALTDNNFCVGDSILLQSEFEHSSYKWLSPSDKVISTEKSTFVSDSGEYRLIATNEYGCSDTSDAFTVKVRLDTNQLSVKYSDITPFEFDTLQLGKRICQNMEITNHSTKDYLLQGFKLKYKYYFGATPSKFPILIKAHQTVNIEVCFAGDSVGHFEDFAVLEDICEPHIVKLEGEIAPFEYNLITKCDVPWEFTSVRLDRDYKFLHSAPFPNPSNGVVVMSFIEFTPKKDVLTSVSVYDSKGNKVADLERRLSSINYYDNGKLEQGEYILNSDLRSGIYFVVVKGQENYNSAPIVIIR